MKSLLCIGLFLLMALPLYAETYSWEDDSGTLNFTEDYSKVPKKHQKKVKRFGDIEENTKTPASSLPEKVGVLLDKTAEKSPANVADEKGLYAGKSFETWRKELDILEAGLKSIEQKMDELRKQMYETKGITNVQFRSLKKEYDDSRAVYEEKYKDYLSVIEAARKAGITVDMKK
jgi:hypothetical protein